MAVSTTDIVYSYNANGVLTAFSFPAKLLAETDVRVYLETGVASGIFTLKTLSTHYTVAFDAEAETCTVTFLVAPTNLYRVVLTRETPKTQGTNLDREGRSPAKTQEGMVDKAVMLSQEAHEKISRAPLFRVAPVDPDPVDIDPLTDRRCLVAEDNGDGTWTLVPSVYDPDEAQADAAASAAAAVASAAAASASAAASAASAAAALASQGAAAASAAAALVSENNAAASAALSVGTSGLLSARPVGGASRLYYYATDAEQEYEWSPAAGRWFTKG